jgi:hypothetical protein
MNTYDHKIEFAARRLFKYSIIRFNTLVDVLNIPNLIKLARQFHEKRTISSKMLIGGYQELRDLSEMHLKRMMAICNRPNGLFCVRIDYSTWSDIAKSLPKHGTIQISIMISIMMSIDDAESLTLVRLLVNDTSIFSLDVGLAFSPNVGDDWHASMIKDLSCDNTHESEYPLPCQANLCNNVTDDDKLVVSCPKCKKIYCMNHVKKHSCKGTCGNPNCTNLKPLHICDGCKIIRYCSVKCQTYDWLIHQSYCEAMKDPE